MTEVYKIGIEIALAGTVMQGLEAIAAKLLGINKLTRDTEGGFIRWGQAIGGVAAIFAGGALAKGLEHAVSAGGELVKQQTLLRNMGISQGDVLETTAKAQLATHQVIGTTIAENVKGMRELLGVMPNLKEAQAAYPAIMQAAKVLEGLTGTPASQNLQVLAKAIELRGGGMNIKTGQLDPERFVKEAEAATRAIVASGGLVSARSLYQYMQTAGPAARAMSDPDVFYKSMLTALMDMGGFRAGTAMTAVQRQLLGGKMTKPTAEEMENIGLLKPGMWHKSGVGVYVDKGGLEGEDILKDPQKGILEWANKILLPALAAKGITKPADVQQELYRVFGTETARRMMGLFIQNQSQIGRDAKLYDNALPDAYGNLVKGDLGANVTNLKDAVTNFLQAFGAPMVPIAINALHSLSDVINSLAGVALAHQDAMKIVGEGLIGLSAGLITLGGAAVIGAALAITGPVGAAILGLGGAITAIAAMNWESVSKAFAGLPGIVTDAIGKVALALGSAIAAIPGQVAAAIGRLGSSIFSFPGLKNLGFPSTPYALPGLAPSAPLPTVIFPQGHAANALRGAGYTPESLKSEMDRESSRGKAYTQPIHIKTAVYLDGRIIGETMSSEMARLSTFPRQAPYGDSYLGWAAPDYNFSTG